MANTIKLGNGNWATKEGSLLAYNDENNNFKPLPFTTTRASSATVVNKQGLIETVGSGIPRIDFSDDANGALLLEPASTNLVTYSEDFSDASWTKGGTSVTSGFVSPDGTLNADKITPTGINEAHQIYQNKTITSNQSYTISAFMKFGGYRYLECRETFGGKGIGFDTTTQTFYGINTPTSFKGVILKNGWVRMEATYTSIGTSAFFLLYSTPILMNPTFLGDGTSGVYTWGAQLEENSYSTSYIKTVGTVQTRVADTASGSGNSTVINSTEGVLYAEISALGDGGVRMISISDGSINNQVSFEYSVVTNLIRIRLISGGDEKSFYQSTNYDYLQYHKIAISYKLNNFKVFIDGINVYTDTDSIMPINLNELSFANGINGFPFYGNTKDLRVYNTALSDAELISLTTI